MVEIIPVSTTLELRAADESHVPALHQLVLKNKAWLQQSLDWPQYVTSQEETRKHVQGNILLHQRGYAKMYLIFCQNEMAGVLSFNAIEPVNKAAYIGYWLMSPPGTRDNVAIITGADDTLCPARRYSALRH